MMSLLPRMFRRPWMPDPDAEIVALHTCHRALASLGLSQRSRVLNHLAEIYDEQSRLHQQAMDAMRTEDAIDASAGM